MSAEIRVGTRASALAMQQTEHIIALMERRFPAVRFRIVEITTHGDRFRDKPISEMGEAVDRGIFNTALEEAVLAGEVDLATCSFKDVESDMPAGLRAITVDKRENHRDVLVSRHGTGVAGLPRGAVLATSSPRRTSQLLAFRPDLRFEPLRGNVTTRVERESRRFDGVVLAAAGMLRLGLQAHIAEEIPEDILLPAPAQGALGCEFMADREDVAMICEAIQDAGTERCVRAEKAVLVRLSGGCFAPIGVYAQPVDGGLVLRCRVVSLDARRKVEAEARGAPEAADELVERVVAEVSAQGGQEIVQETRAAMQQPADKQAP